MGIAVAAVREPADTIRVVRNTIRKIARTKRKMRQSAIQIAPAATVTPFPPPENPWKSGKIFPIRQPKTAAYPDIISPITQIENGSQGKTKRQKSPTAKHFTISRTITGIPYFAPIVLATFVPPAFPLPRV